MAISIKYPAAAARGARALLLGLAMGGLGAGCSSVPKQPYEYGRLYESPRAFPLPDGEPQFSRGRPHRLLDASDWIWPGSLLGKLLLWNRKIDSHQVAPETEAYLAEYLRRNEMDAVKVRINEYAVGGEWRRLVNNREVGAGWRYTVGLFSWLYYTLLPGRFFGGDHYNPYTNTIHIYSDIPTVLLHEGGHAKDSARRRWKGTYAFTYIFPLVPLWHEAEATGDAIGYLRDQELKQEEADGYKVLYPAYGTYAGGGAADILQFTSVEGWVYYTAIYAPVIPGHIIGRLKARRVAANAPLPEPADDETPARLEPSP
jgi:hypothetical protein